MIHAVIIHPHHLLYYIYLFQLVLYENGTITTLSRKSRLILLNLDRQMYGRFVRPL